MTQTLTGRVCFTFYLDGQHKTSLTEVFVPVMEMVIRTPKTTAPTSLTAHSWTLIKTGSGTSVMTTTIMMASWMIKIIVDWWQTQTRRMKTVRTTKCA